MSFENMTMYFLFVFVHLLPAIETVERFQICSFLSTFITFYHNIYFCKSRKQQGNFLCSFVPIQRSITTRRIPLLHLTRANILSPSQRRKQSIPRWSTIYVCCLNVSLYISQASEYGTFRMPIHLYNFTHIQNPRFFLLFSESNTLIGVMLFLGKQLSLLGG